MSHRTFNKSTRKDVEEMMILLKSGMRLSDIAKTLKRDRATIIYWRNKIGLNNIFVENLEPKEVVIEMGKKEEPKVDLTNCCKVCRGEKKDKRFALTDYCGLNCWHKENKREEQNLYW